MGQVVAVLNMKGGVGKTTISAHVMRVLYRRRRLKTLLVDLDPQFNLTQTLITQFHYDQLLEKQQTIFAAMEPTPNVGLLKVNVTDQPPPKPHDLAYELKSFAGYSAYLHLIAGNFDLTKYSIIEDYQKLGRVNQRFRRFISDCKNIYDLIVIDCNPSSSFITRCALEVCDRLLVPVKPDRYSILGLGMLDDLVENLPTIHPKPDIDIILNGIPAQGYNKAVENELRAHEKFGAMVLSNRIRHSKILSADPGYTGFATDKGVPYRHLLSLEISYVADELASRWGM